ncbi:YidC/Oxa1 family membrane protein insertase [Micromonosporaceae bacterium Da 78-11]
MSISAAFGAVVGAAHSAIEGLAVLLTPTAGSLAVAFAIVVFTLLVRLLISPLTYVQVRGERRRAILAPHLEKLRAKHGDDHAALAAATMELHRAHGISLFGGLLPGLAQAPFFMVMYQVAAHAPAGAVFGIPLTAHVAAGLPVFAVLLALSIAIAWWSARRTPAVTGQLALMRHLPYLTVLMVAWLPLAGALYLVTSTAWTALERAIWRRPVTTGNR